MTIEALPGWAAEHLRRARVGRLGFADDEGRPRVLPVTFALHAGAVWTAIDAKPKRAGQPARVRWLERRPEAALCVDHYSDDWEELAWVQALGRVEVREIEHEAPALEELARKYPQYVKQPPPGPLLRLEVERALCWRAADAVS